MTSCFPFAQYESARTLGKGKGSIGVTGLGYLLYDPSSNLPNGKDYKPYGTAELAGGYGLTERSDIRLMMNTYGFTYLDFKHMLVGDKESTFALASGLGVDANPFLILAQNPDPYFKINLPLFMSWHKSDKYFFVLPKLSYSLIFKSSHISKNTFVGMSFGGGFFLNNIEIYAGTGPTLHTSTFRADNQLSLLWQTGIGARYYIR